MKLGYLVALAPLLLAACETSQVQQTCAEAQQLVAAAAPFLSIAPVEVRVAVMALNAGTVGCQTPEYAALRERVVAWLRSRR